MQVPSPAVFLPFHPTSLPFASSLCFLWKSHPLPSFLCCHPTSLSHSQRLVGHQEGQEPRMGNFSRALNPASLAPQHLGERSSLPHHQCCPFSFASTQTTSCISSGMPQHPGDTNATFPVIPGGKKNPEKFTLIFFFFFLKQNKFLFQIPSALLEGAKKHKL